MPFDLPDVARDEDAADFTEEGERLELELGALEGDHPELEQTIAVNRYGGKNDPIVVRTEDFKPYLETYIERWRASWTDEDDPNDEANDHRGRNRITPAGALEVLADESGIMQRRILAIRKSETQYTSLRTFDNIITAMGMPGLAQSLTLYRNPLWSVGHFLEWLGEQDLTPEDINVRRWPPGAGWKHLERTTRRLQAKRASMKTNQPFSVRGIIS